MQRWERLANNKSGKYISIDVLEMVCVIINFAAAIYICNLDGMDFSTHPVLLNWCDNTSACLWVNYKCQNSLIGRAFGPSFIGLLMVTKLGIQAEWLPTHLYVIADDISCLEDEDGNYNYSRLILDPLLLKIAVNFSHRIPSHQIPNIQWFGEFCWAANHWIH